MKQFTHPGLNQVATDPAADAARLNSPDQIKERIKQNSAGIAQQNEHILALLEPQQQYSNIQDSLDKLMEAQTFAPASALMETYGICEFQGKAHQRQIDTVHSTIDDLERSNIALNKRLQELSDD